MHSAVRTVVGGPWRADVTMIRGLASAPAYRSSRHLGGCIGTPGRPLPSRPCWQCPTGVCLLGPSGSGKTTLFKTLLGVLPAQAGAVAVAVDGIDIARLSRRALARTTAYVPQSAAAPFPFTVRESVTMGRAGRVALFSLPAERGRPRRRGGAAGDGHRAPRRAVDFGDQRR